MVYDIAKQQLNAFELFLDMISNIYSLLNYFHLDMTLDGVRFLDCYMIRTNLFKPLPTSF